MVEEDTLRVLINLRTAAKISRNKAGELLGLDGKHCRKTVKQWETGEAVPPESRRREKFQYYMRDYLAVTKPKEFFSIWKKIMVASWNWKSLTSEEWKKLFPGRIDALVKMEDGNTEYIYFASENRFLFSAPRLPQYTLLGRDNLIEQIVESILKGEDIALHGLPGVGKTALAIAIANNDQIINHFADGILWLGVGKQGDILALLAQIGSWLGLSSELIAKDSDIEKRAKTIYGAIGLKRLLIIIDDVWNDEGRHLMVGGPNCVHMLTTRSAQNAVNSDIYTILLLEELDSVTSIKLMEKLTSKELVSKNNAGSRLAKLTGGLPLAIILIGHYIRSNQYKKSPRTMEDIIKQLHDSKMRMEIQKPQQIMYKQPSLSLGENLSLRAIIQLSYELLDIDEKNALNNLAILPAKPNHFSTEAGENIIQQSQLVMEQLKSYGLLEQVVDGRWTIHQTIVDYCNLMSSSSVNYERTSKYFIEFLVGNKTEFVGIIKEYQNIRTALDIAKKIQRWDLFVTGSLALLTPLITQGDFITATKYINGLTSRILQDSLKSSQKIELLFNKSKLQELTNNFDGAVASSNEALDLAETIGDDKWVCDLKIVKGKLAFRNGEILIVEQLYKEALYVAEKIGYENGIYQGYSKLCSFYRFQNRQRLAVNHGLKSLEIARKLNRLDYVCDSHINVGAAYSLAGENDISREHYLQSLNIARTIEYKETIIYALSNLGSLESEEGNLELAEKYLSDGLAIARGMPSYKEGLLIILSNLGYALLQLDKLGLAAEYLYEALQIARQITNNYLLATTLNDIGELHINRVETWKAKEAFAEAKEVAEGHRFMEQLGLAIWGLGKVEFANGDHKQAILLGNQSKAILADANKTWEREVSEWLSEIEDVT